jgi:hypothetical protein
MLAMRPDTGRGASGVAGEVCRGRSDAVTTVTAIARAVPVGQKIDDAVDVAGRIEEVVRAGLNRRVAGAAVR